MMGTCIKRNRLGHIAKDLPRSGEEEAGQGRAGQSGDSVAIKAEAESMSEMCSI